MYGCVQLYHTEALSLSLVGQYGAVPSSCYGLHVSSAPYGTPDGQEHAKRSSGLCYGCPQSSHQLSSAQSVPDSRVTSVQGTHTGADCRTDEKSELYSVQAAYTS